MLPGWLLQILIGIVLTGVSALVQAAFSGPDTKRKPGVKGRLRVGGVSPLSFIMGTYGTDGHLVYGETYGDSGGTPNEYLTLVISLSDIPITGLSRMWINSTQCTVDLTTTPVDKGYVIPEFSGSAWIKFYDGTQTTSDSFLTSKFGSHPEHPFTSDMIGRGVAYAIVTFAVNREKFNKIPECVFEIKGIPLYDPRKDSTAGGSGSHRITTPSTWEHSDNPKVHQYNILNGIRYGGDYFWGARKSVAQSRLPYAMWSAAMDKCDTLVSLDGGGSEKQFTTGCEIEVSDQPIDILSKLDISCNGRMSEKAGVFNTVVGTPPGSVMSFTDDDIITSETQTMEPFPALQDTINGITCSYAEPLEAWNLKEAPPRYSITYEALDDGRRLTKKLQLDFVSSVTQAQRIGKAIVEESRRFVTHLIVLKPSFSVLEPIDMVTWASTRNGYSAKEFIVTATHVLRNGNVVIGLAEFDPADHDWTSSSDEIPSSVAPLTSSRPASQPVTGFTVNGATLDDDNGVPKWPTVAVSFPKQADVSSIWVQTRLKSSGDVVFDGNIPVDQTVTNGTTFTHLLNIKLIPETEYETRIKYIPFSGRLTDWSAWLAAITPNIRPGMDDMDQAFQDYQAFMGAEVQDLLELYARLDDASSDDVWNRYSDKQELRTELASATGDITAAYVNAIYAATGPSSALVARVEKLELIDLGNFATVSVTDAITVRLDDSTTGLIASADAITALEGVVGYDSGAATFRMQTGYTPETGWTSKIGFQAWSSGASTYFDAGIYIEANNTTSRVLLDGDQVAIKAGGSVAALFKSGTTFIDTARITDLTTTNFTAKSINADTIMIDGTIVEDLISAGAISLSSSGEISNVSLNNSGSEYTLFSDTVTIKDGRFIILVTGIVGTLAFDSSYYGEYTFRLKIGGVTKRTVKVSYDENGIIFQNGAILFNYSQIAASSSLSFSVTYQRTRSTGNAATTQGISWSLWSASK